MKYHLDLERLSSLVSKKCGTKGLRETSNEIGISASTLSRLMREQHVPDIETFTALCNWLDVPPSTFFRGDELSSPMPVPEAIALQLQSDKNLDPATANALAVLIKAAYRDLTS